MLSSNYSTAERIKISLSNISLPWLVIRLVIFVGLIKLGMWQSSRAVEKEQRLDRMVELKQQDSLSLSQVLALESSNNQIDYLNDFPVVINGSFIPGIIFLLDNFIFVSM